MRTKEEAEIRKEKLEVQKEDIREILNISIDLAHEQLQKPSNSVIMNIFSKFFTEEDNPYDK